MPDERVGGRFVVLFIALTVHCAVGLIGVSAAWWRTGRGFFDSGEPHPLGAWEGPARIVWVAILGILLALTAWPDPRQRRALQMVLPCAALAAWSAVVGLVGPYPVTLRAELRDGAMTVSAAMLAPGPQSLAIRNATGTEVRVTAVRSDQPLDASALANGFAPSWADGQWTTGVEWFHLKPIGCFMDCEPGDLQIGPRDETRHAVDLLPGYYAIVCVRPAGREGNTYTLAVDNRCRPALFTVGPR